MSLRRSGLAAFLAVAIASQAGAADDQPSLADYFGFDGQRMIVVDTGCGPLAVADFNASGRPDIAVVNNRKSRIELHTLRAERRPETELRASLQQNELPPSPWYDRTTISVRHRIAAVLAADLDADGLTDIVYAGADPLEIVVLRQVAPGEFEAVARRRVDKLAANPDAFAIGEIYGRGDRHLVTIAGGRIATLAIDSSGAIGEPKFFGADGEFRTVFVEDFNADGSDDLLAQATSELAPVRLWIQTDRPGSVPGEGGMLNTEFRFESPPVSDLRPVRAAGRDGAFVGSIETSSRRIVLHGFHDAVSQTDASDELTARVTRFRDGASSTRSTVVADLAGRGRPDLIATNARDNTIDVFFALPDKGYTDPESFPTFKNPSAIALGRWNGDTNTEIFVLSEDESSVGVSSFDRETGALTFPEPIQIATGGSQPVAMGYLELEGAPTLAVVVRQRRDLVLELHSAPSAGYDPVTIPLASITRPPASILVADADRDGIEDLLLLTPGQPMVMIRGAETDGRKRPAEVLTRESMGQFGLVQAAGPGNTLTMDFTGDGRTELVIAEQNFVRACVYDADTGWRVVAQVNTQTPDTEFVGLAAVDGEIVAADRRTGAIISLVRDEGSWRFGERSRLVGFPIGPIRGLGADRGRSILCTGEDGFAEISLEGPWPALQQHAAHRPDADDRREHQMAVGDVNNDGFTDLVVIDAAEQMCTIITLSEAGRLKHATEFKVFESRLFSRGRTREFQPSRVFVTDLTGDNRDDVLLIAHDRLIIYPQATAESGRAGGEAARRE